MKESKLLASYKTRPETIGGSPCIIRYNVYSDGVVVIEKRMFITEPAEKRPDWVLLREFNGRKYCCQAMGFRYRTLASILRTVTEELMANNVKKEDLA